MRDTGYLTMDGAHETLPAADFQSNGLIQNRKEVLKFLLLSGIRDQVSSMQFLPIPKTLSP